MRNRAILVTLVIFIFTGLGCTSGGGNPATPDLQQPAVHSADSSNSTHPWGIWEVSINPETSEAEILPLRGLQFTANVTQFMQPPISPTNLLAIAIDPRSDFATGHIIVNIAFTHPFPGLDLYTGFDVRGVCIGNASTPFVSHQGVQYANDAELRVLNADGYTRWFNPTEFTTYGTIFGFTQGRLGVPSYAFNSTLNGYKYYCDDIDTEDEVVDFFTDPGCQNPRGFFRAGNTVVRQFDLQFPMVGGAPELNFQYAVVASWQVPAYEPPQNIPDDFPMDANCAEAYCFSTTDMSDMYYYDPSNYGGSLRLMVRVFDHQGAVSMSGVKDEISGIVIEEPYGLIPGTASEFRGASLDASLVAEDEISATWLLEVIGVEPSAVGDVPVMLAFESADPGTYDSGFPGFEFPDGPLAAYMKTTVFVSGEMPIQVIAIDPDSGEQDSILTDVEVTGTGFDTGAQVSLIFSDGPGTIEADNEVVSGNGTIVTCDLDLTAAELGLYHVRVTNPSTEFGQLDEGFEVTEPSGYPYWWECIMYNPTHLGRNPMASTPDPEDLTTVWTPVSTSGSVKYNTPVVAENKIYFSSCTGVYANTSALVQCYDLLTGAFKWSAYINPTNNYGRFQPGIAFWRDESDNEYVVVGGDEVYCFDANTGGEEWSYDDMDPSDQNWLSSQLIVYEDLVLAKGRQDPALYVLDCETGSLIREIALDARFEAGVGAADGKAYTVGYQWGGVNMTYLECFDIDTGVEEWEWTSSESVDHWCNPCIEDGRVYITTYQGRVHCIAAETQGSYEPGDHIWQYSTISLNPLCGGVAKFGDDLYFGAAFSNNPIYAITDQGNSASLKWLSPTLGGGYFDAATTVTVTDSYPDGVVIAMELGGAAYFLDATNGSLIRTIPSYGSDTFRGGAAIAGDYVTWVGATYLYCYH